MSSPVLNIPDWPNHCQPSDVYTIPPISSSVQTPSNGDSWDIFDETFGKVVDLSPLTSPTIYLVGESTSKCSGNASQPIWNPTWSPTTDVPGSASSYLPLSMIYDPATACDDDKGGETEVPVSSYQPSERCESPPSPRKAAGRGSGYTRRASGSMKSGRHSTRSRRRESSSSIETGTSPPKGHQLRSTRQGYRIRYIENDSTNDVSKTAKTSHNLVEKQYRTRLNGQFSNLLSTLPSEVIGTEVDGNDSGAEKRVSKAEVLMFAKRHIENLERTKRLLEDDKRALLEDVQRLKGTWVRMGGEVMP